MAINQSDERPGQTAPGSGAPRAPAGMSPRGLYYEDFEIGLEITTPRRTVTQTDIVNYSGLSGDFLPPHMDWEFCKQQPYGEPIAHGPLILAIASGLLCQSGIYQGTVIAMLGVDKWRIHAPVKHGDTLHVIQSVLSKRPSSNGGRGIVTFLRRIINQRDEVVQSLETTNMFLCRPL